MGGTKSKVEDTQEEDIDSSSRTSDSTRRTSNSPADRSSNRHGGQKRPLERRKRQSDGSTPSPDEILDKPFKYRSRKDRLLESLNIGDRNDESSDDYFQEKARNGKIVQTIVENIQANLNAKSSSTSSIRDGLGKKTSKRLNDNTNNKKSARRKSSGKVVGKEVKPTGVEEKIIESLIKPRKRQSSLPRSIKIKDSTPSVNVHPVSVSFQPASTAPKPPEPPPIDFSEASSDEGPKINKKQSALTSSSQGNDLKQLTSILPKREPSHLKELKQRFGNEVPRSPLEDNLNTSTAIDKPHTNLEKPLYVRESSSSKSYFTNNVPVADSLHIINEKVVIKGAKDQERRSNGRSRHRKSQTSNKDLCIDGKPDSRPNSASPKSILKSTQDDAIKCFPVKTEYNEDNNLKDSSAKDNTRKGRDRQKTARTQTSSLGLVDSGVQTLPDLGFHAVKKDEEYESAIDSKAKKVLRRVSMDRSVEQKVTKDRRGRRYRNGSTQWEEVDLLDNSTCSTLNRKERPRSKSRTRVKPKEKQHCGKAEDCRDCYNEVCCMHLQVIPHPPERRERRESRSKILDRGKQPSKDNTRGGKNCRECSRSRLSSWEKLTDCATYSTSSGRSKELSLLTTFRSTSTVRSKSKPKDTHSKKNDDVYRQMEELGLGFLRDGEWVTCGVSYLQSIFKIFPRFDSFPSSKIIKKPLKIDNL